MTEANNIRIDENFRLSTDEFVNVMPSLAFDDLLLTEYRVDGKWNRLIQLKDSKKKLYLCCLCNVVQSGVKNIFAHVGGKKHKLKIKSIKQLYQPKYTFFKKSTGSPPPFLGGQLSNPHKSEAYPKANTCTQINNLYCDRGRKRSLKTIQDTDDKYELEGTQIPDDINSSPSGARKTMLIKNLNDLSRSLVEATCTRNSCDKLEELNTLSTEIKNDNNGQKLNIFRARGLYPHNDRNVPPAKIPKIVPNPAAINRGKIGEIFELSTADEEKAVYLSNVAIMPTKKKGSPKEPCHDHLFSTKRLMNYDVLGLIGVEYVVKIVRRPKDTNPKYECSLCEVVSNGLGMQNHLLGYNHRLKFCEKHFPTALRQYKQYIRNIKSAEIYKVMTPILNKLAIAIENHHGRDLPYECVETEYINNRHEVLSKVFSSRHASEQYGPTFTHIVDSKQVDKLIKEIDKYHSPSFPSNIAFDLCLNKTSLNSSYAFNIKQSDHNSHANCIEDQSLHPYDKIVLPGIQNVHSNIVAKDYSLTSNTRTPGYPFTRATDQNLSISDNMGHIWKVYRHIVDQNVIALNKSYQIYRSDPESHPAYNQEWQTFWKCRKNELIEAGLDHRTYNYQPEWVRFFNIRIEELYNEGIKGIKRNARDILGLPITTEDMLERYHVHVGNTKANSNFTDGRKFGNDCVIKLHAVSVIRLLKTLEKYLGSLGPKIVELLSKVLDAERNNPAELDAMILNEKTCALLETAMDKFESLVIANILEDDEQHSLRVAIKEIEILLSRSKNIPRNLHPTVNFEELENIVCYDTGILPQTYLTSNGSERIWPSQNNISQVDKRDLAVKLANLLAEQGKTDIDPTQLQKILSVYMMIEKKKNNNDI